MMTLWRDRPWVLRGLTVILSAAVVWLLQAFVPRAFEGVEEAAGDLSWRLGASSAAERRLVVVDIDEASLREVGPWPWSRTVLADIAQRLKSAGASVQVYDIAFSDAREGDADLRQAWTGASIVTGQVFSLDPAVTPRAGVVAGGTADPRCPAHAPVSHGYYGTAPVLLEARPAVGHLTPRVEQDGMVRKLPALICHEGRAYPSLALAALWRAAVTGTEASPDWRWVDGAGSSADGWLAPAASLTSASWPGLRVPLDAHGDLRVPYRLERKALASVSAADVLAGRVDMAMFKDTIVLVGATAFGIGDTVATPHAAVSSGLEVHAQAIVGLLDQRIPYTPAGWRSLQALAIVILGVLLVAALARRRGVPAKRLPIAGLLLALAIGVGASFALLGSDLWLPWSATALFALVASLALATAEHALARAQRERLSAHLGAYLPAPVAQRLMLSDPSGSVQVDQRQVTALVADIRNFSAFAAHRPAEATAAMLHAFCCIAVDVVEQHGGVVENVVGDSVLAVWNAYSECADHPRQALAAAQELLRATQQLLASAGPTSEHSPVQPLALGVGVETGLAIVGTFGPSRRRAHAALGEPVSVASRVQAMTLDLSTPILMGPELAARLPAEASEPLGDYLLEGLSRQYTLYAPKAWAELVPADPNWVSTATSNRPTEPSDWSRWSDSGPTGPFKPGTSLREA